jgi:hypothetical protein
MNDLLAIHASSVDVNESIISRPQVANADSVVTMGFVLW